MHRPGGRRDPDGSDSGGGVSVGHLRTTTRGRCCRHGAVGQLHGHQPGAPRRHAQRDRRVRGAHRPRLHDSCQPRRRRSGIGAGGRTVDDRRLARSRLLHGLSVRGRTPPDVEPELACGSSHAEPGGRDPRREPRDLRVQSRPVRPDHRPRRVVVGRARPVRVDRTRARCTTPVCPGSPRSPPSVSARSSFRPRRSPLTQRPR